MSSHARTYLGHRSRAPRNPSRTRASLERVFPTFLSTGSPVLKLHLFDFYREVVRAANRAVGGVIWPVI